MKRHFQRFALIELAVVLVIVVIVGAILAARAIGLPWQDAISLPTPTPLLTYQLEVISDPPEAADFFLQPQPDAEGAYPAGTTVNINAVPRQGWRIEEWVGPLLFILGERARIDMDSQKTVVVKLTREPVATPIPTSTRPPAPIATPTPTLPATPEPTRPAATPPIPTATPVTTPTPTPTPTALPTPTPQPPPPLLCGNSDDNGEVNTADVATVLQFVVGTTDLSSRQAHQANVLPGDLNVADADSILQHIREGRVDDLTCSSPASVDRL